MSRRIANGHLAVIAAFTAAVCSVAPGGSHATVTRASPSKPTAACTPEDLLRCWLMQDLPTMTRDEWLESLIGKDAAAGAFRGAGFDSHIEMKALTRAYELTRPYIRNDQTDRFAGRQYEDALKRHQQGGLRRQDKAARNPFAALYLCWFNQARWRPYAEGRGDPEGWQQIIAKVAAEIGEDGKPFDAPLRELVTARAPGSDARWRDLYVRACALRRRQRLARLREAGWRQIAFVKHPVLGGSHYAYTEAQSDAQHESHFVPGAALCLLDITADPPRIVTLLEDPDGMIRDPDVSFDAARTLFAWKKGKLGPESRRSGQVDDFHLYEIDLATGGLRQLTSGLGFADYEGAYLPDGGIVFNSTRCVQTVDCFFTEVSNLFTCDGDGQYLRRLCFDQVHTNYPTVTHDGSVLYTRWDYNDRAQVYPQPLFMMNPDGTGQTEFYGNNSYSPTALLHARMVPGTTKVIATATGHHSDQSGKIVLIDRSRGQQEMQGVTILGPDPAEEKHELLTRRADSWGQDTMQYAYPYPIDESRFLVTFDPRLQAGGRMGSDYGLYLMDADGGHELLAFESGTSCCQAVPVAPRQVFRRPNLVDYRQDTGTVYLQDVYVGPPVKGVQPGTIKTIRVVALEYRHAAVPGKGVRGEVGGPAGFAWVSTPISYNGSWDVKKVLGTVPVEPDGSACFEVPARTPLYFQLLDERGRMVQSMRSWTTVQPGETQACIGCHEPKSMAPPAGYRLSMALKAAPRKLAPFYGPPRGFSFPKEIQPILDRHCVRCHDGKRRHEGKPVPLNLTAAKQGSKLRAWSESYMALTENGKKDRGRNYQHFVHWIDCFGPPTMVPPYSYGSPKSKLLDMLEAGHYEVRLARAETDRIACWMDLAIPFAGDYDAANDVWSEEDKALSERFAAKRARQEQSERQNIEHLIRDMNMRGALDLTGGR